MVYNFHRYYDAHLGRYLQTDPVFQDTNQLYSYSKQNPSRYFDSLGLFEIDSSCNKCKYKNLFDEAQKECENSSNNMSSSDYGAGKFKDCVKKYCKEATIKCSKGKDCQDTYGHYSNYGEITLCSDNVSGNNDLYDTLTHEVCHICDPDDIIEHGSDPTDSSRGNIRWERAGCTL